MEKRIKINILGLKIVLKNPFAVSNNKIILTKNGKSKRLFFVKGLKVKYYGANNRIEFIDKVPKMKNVHISCGENCRIRIGASSYAVKNLDINARAENSEVNIGRDFSIESGCIDFHGEPNLQVNIGDDCQFGCDIRFDPADGHTIYNADGALNTPKSITIGNHVWLCRQVSVLKGAEIADNCVVGLGSIVTGVFKESGRLLAGIPAKQIESEQYKKINWTRLPNKSFVKCNTIHIELHWVPQYVAKSPVIIAFYGLYFSFSFLRIKRERKVRKEREKKRLFSMP